MRKKWGKRLAAFTLATAMCVSDLGGTGLTGFLTEVSAAEAVDTSADYVFSKDSEWDTNEVFNDIASLNTDTAPVAGTKLNLNVLIPVPEGGAALSFEGILKVVGVYRTGAKWDWAQSADIPELTAADFTETETIGGVEYYKKNVDVVFATAAADKLAAVTVQFAGYQCDYAGKIAISDAKLVVPEESGSEQTEVKKWSFDSGTENWYYAGWEWNYTSTGSATVANDNGMLKITTDFTDCEGFDWSNFAVAVDDASGFTLQGATQMNIKVRYNAAALQAAGGTLKLGVYALGGLVDSTAAIDPDAATPVTGTDYVEQTLTLAFDEITQVVPQVALKVVGCNTNYAGDFWIDDVTAVSTATTEDAYVDATKTATVSPEKVSVANNKMTSYKGDGAAQVMDVNADLKLVDGDADTNTQAIYAYLQTMGASDSVIFGHQNDTWHKAGLASLSNSDTTDVTGSISGVVGIDALSLTGNEYSASRYNSEIGDQVFPETAAGNVAAAAALTNKNIEEGAIITLSAHMPNFSLVEEDDDYEPATDPAYAKYDFSGYTPNTLTGDVMNKILPGGEFNEQYTAYLDMLADYASQINGTILFRPFHENTGSWFWWGAAFCDAQTYKNVYKYTVEYMRDEKNLHNILYVYGPGSEAASTTEYGERYPGDDYVDMIGFDMYHQNPSDSDTWFDSFATELSIVEQFAEEHNKLITVTETGVANAVQPGDNQTALKKTGNEQLDWYNKMLDAVSGSKASYFLLWANFGEKDGFYTPYVKSVGEDGVLHGQEELDYFIDFYNDPRSVFAVNQKDTLATLNSALTLKTDATTTSATGYITAPVSGSRIIKPITLSARVRGLEADEVVKFVLKGEGDAREITATASTAGNYAAEITQTDLTAVGSAVGTIDLYVGETKLDTIAATFNIAEPEEDPYEIDSFENYSGVDSLLAKKWATNKASGSTIDLSLISDAGKYCAGEYGLKFTYNEKSDGWAGATISKEVNWSDCNALQFWTIPDGNKQKVVIQLTASGNVYEAYLNNYDDYKMATGPVLVTIPFSDFVARDITGNPAGGLVHDCSSVTSFGLWVNAIAGSDAIDEETDMVSGTIYYDKITAINTDIENPTFGAVTVSDITSISATAYLIAQGTGDYYYEVLPATADVPADGAAVEAAVGAVASGTQAQTKDMTSAITMSDLQANTAYSVYLTEKVGGVYTPVQRVNFTTKKESQREITITGIPTESITYGDKFTIGVTGGDVADGVVSYAVTSGNAEIDAAGAVTITGVGTTTIKATKAGNDSYEPVSTSVTFKSVKAEQKEVTITGVPSKVYIGDTFTVQTEGGNSEGKVTYKIIEGSDAASINATSGEVKVTGLGTVKIQTTKASDKNYKKVTGTVSFNSVKAEQPALTLSGVPSSVAYGDSFTLKTAGGNGTGAVSYAVTEGKDYATVDKNGKVTVTGVGKVAVTATKAADTNYSETNATVTFTSTKAAQSALKISGVSSKLTGGKSATLKVTGGSGTGKVTYKVTSGSKYASVSSTGKVTVKGIGKVTITATKAADANYNATSAKISFTTKVAAKNAKVTVGNLKYQVTKSSTKSGTVAVYAPKSSKATSVTIPASVKIGGVSFKVTSISKNAFKNCSKLKTITIKSKTIKSVGSNAFKGISKKAVIKVPSSKLSSYKKLLKGKGQKSTVKIKKY